MDYYQFLIIILEIIFFLTIVLMSIEKINKRQAKKTFIILIIITVFAPFLKLLN